LCKQTQTSHNRTVEYTSFAEVEIVKEPEYHDPMIEYNIIVNRNGINKIVEAVSGVWAS
jgi:hypothetical protein